MFPKLKTQNGKFEIINPQNHVSSNTPSAQEWSQLPAWTGPITKARNSEIPLGGYARLGSGRHLTTRNSDKAADKARLLREE